MRLSTIYLVVDRQTADLRIPPCDPLNPNLDHFWLRTPTGALGCDECGFRVGPSHPQFQRLAPLAHQPDADDSRRGSAECARCSHSVALNQLSGCLAFGCSCREVQHA